MMRSLPCLPALCVASSSRRWPSGVLGAAQSEGGCIPSGRRGRSDRGARRQAHREFVLTPVQLAVTGASGWEISNLHPAGHLWFLLRLRGNLSTLRIVACGVACNTIQKIAVIPLAE